MDIHSTDSNNLTTPLTRSSVMKVLFAAMFLVTAAFESLAEETFPPTSMTVSEAPFCVGDDVTVTILAPDTVGANTLQSVPWQVSYNGPFVQRGTPGLHHLGGGNGVELWRIGPCPLS